ncbi:MAG: SUMF1/EgtB/PvdO family nonheme iron enzyme [Acidobacteriota bacterium]|nr:MAG: SUMF1/EgtB/PvdO family nonheme iron enzyme [Acidobacteriota bacterium]
MFFNINITLPKCFSEINQFSGCSRQDHAPAIDRHRASHGIDVDHRRRRILIPMVKDKTDSGSRPVVQTNWRDAVEFCARLAKKTGRSYRLPIISRSSWLTWRRGV